LNAGYAYWWALLIPAITNFGWGFLTLRLVSDPVDMGIITDDVRIQMEENAINAAVGEEVDDSGHAPISYAGALRIPMVAQYAFAFVFSSLQTMFSSSGFLIFLVSTLNLSLRISLLLSTPLV
jgi:hypothetical protein